MQWNRIKTILIVVFLLANVYLVTNYLYTTGGSSKIDGRVIEDVVSILSEKNVSIDKAIIPTTIKQMRVFNVASSMGNRHEIASGILGNDYFMKDQGVFSKDTLVMWINGNNFDLVETAEVLREEVSITESAAKALAEKELKARRLYCKNAVIESCVREAEAYVIRYGMYLDGLPVVDSSMTVHIGNRGLVKMEGRNWLGDNITEGQYVSTAGIVEVLISFANSDRIDKSAPIRIERLRRGYYLGKRPDEVSVVEAIPVWVVVDSGGKEYLFDNRTGNLI